MSFFSPGRTLGVDVGTSKLKVVELQTAKGGKAELSTYGMATLPDDLVRRVGAGDDMVVEISKALRAILAKADMQATKVYASLPGFSVFSEEVVLQQMPMKDVEAAVHEEAAKRVEGNVEDMILDWEILENLLPPEGGKMKSPDPEGTIRVLLTAAPRVLVEEYDQIFEDAGLRLESLETEAIALTRSLIGRDGTPTLLVDIGSTATDLIFVNGAMPRSTTTIDVGGLAMTQALATGMGVSLEQAEQVKKDIGLGEEGSKASPELRQVMEQILSEVEGLLSRVERDVERIVLAGGAAKLRGFDMVLRDRTNLPTTVGNPFARVLHPQELDTLLRDVGPDLSVAIGLAMKEIY